MRKVSIIGAGNVGATAAMEIAKMEIATEIILLDIKEGVAEGKAMDISQACSILGINAKVIGVTNNYEALDESDVIIITSGVPRKPGMTREELVGVNKGVIDSVMANIKDNVHNINDVIFVVVSNPMDTMTMEVAKFLKAETSADVKKHVLGMGNLLDSNRFKFNIAKKYQEKFREPISLHDINAMVIGGHGDTTMIPIIETATYRGLPITYFFDEEEILDIIDKTKRGGAILTGMLGTSAWEGPASAIAVTVKAILNNESKVIPCSVWHEGHSCFIGMPAMLTSNGIGEIFYNYTQLQGVVNDFNKSVTAVKEVNKALN